MEPEQAGLMSLLFFCLGLLLGIVLAIVGKWASWLWDHVMR